jgi:hypothetical protein
MPPRILSRPTSIRRLLVSSFFADVTQQIHSFRASGVMLAQRSFAARSASMALRKSAGSLCTIPVVAVFFVAVFFVAVFFVAMDQFTASVLPPTMTLSHVRAN